MYAGVGAPGSAHDARMLRASDSILKGGAIPDRKRMVGQYGDIPLVTGGDRDRNSGSQFANANRF